MCMQSDRSYQVALLLMSTTACLLSACLSPGPDPSETDGGFVVGGASGIAGPGTSILIGATDPGNAGTTASTGIGGVGSAQAIVGTGPGFPNDFRLLSIANGRLVQLGINPPALIPIGVANLAGTAIATAPDGTLFGLTSDIAGNTQLVTISSTTGAVTPVGPVSTLNFAGTGLAFGTAAFAPSGTLFASPGNLIFGIDATTGQTTSVLSSAAFGAFTFTPGGVLVGTSAAGLVTLDVNTGLTTGLLAATNQIPLAPSIQGITFGPDGFIYAVGDPFAGQANLIRVDPDTGAAVLLATYNSNLFGLVVQPL